MNDRLATALTGRYRIEHELGQGGMATVYLAHDIKHDRKVAIKVLREDLAASLGSARFLHEIKVAAALQHPHILPLYDSGEAGDLLFYVMPYVDGMSLRDKLIKEGELPIGDAVRILRDIADALTEAHRHGVVHRDLKPENVMLRGRHALVMDFGVAKALSEATGRQALTTIGVALGTPTYMAPEQAVADPHVDHRADLYAFGVVAYELLAGRPPFTGTNPQQILAAQVTAAPEPVTTHRTMPPALAALVMRCLAKRPADRFQSAEELIPQLESVLTPSGGMTPTATMPFAAVTAPHPRRLAWAAALGVLTLLLAFVAWRAMHRNPAAPSRLATVSGAPKRVGVLPFESRSRDTSDAYLGDGIATDLTTALAGMTGLQVVSRSSTFALRGKTAREAGAALAADAMVEGTVGKVDDRLRVTVSLVNVADEAVLWSKRYDVTDKDLYAFQDSAAPAIASALGVGLARRADAGLAAHRTTNPEAHDLVLRGQFLLDQATEAGIHEAISLFERAAKLDSTYADPWNGIAQAWYYLADTYVAPRVAVPPMRSAIDKALALDPGSAWAHALKGSLSSYLRNFDDAEKEFLTAIALDSTAELAGDYGWLLHSRGLDDSALAVLRRARRHNPYAFEPLNATVTILSNAERLDSAIVLCRAIQEVASDFCAETLLIQQGRAADVVATWTATPPVNLEAMLDFALALARTGDTAAARRELSAALAKAGVRYVREDYVAGVYLALGDTARTLEWLTRGLDAQAADMAQINRLWRFKPLHGNPGFDAIVRKAGLKPWP